MLLIYQAIYQIMPIRIVILSAHREGALINSGTDLPSIYCAAASGKGLFIGLEMVSMNKMPECI
jgi:hypothetical protein